MKNIYNILANILWIIGLLLLIPSLLGIITSTPSILDKIIFDFPTKTNSVDIFFNRVIVINFLAYIFLIFVCILKCMYHKMQLPSLKKGKVSIKYIMLFIFKSLMIVITIIILLISFLATLIASISL
ncbi:hypothetical protein DWV06_16855 [Anaerosacchariphilus polymeriproducens]|uniref:Uncharacterized protein n=1 Tax=Anaerosacchariphilus polymeriproducens TaxID=1812858 RepID=A0A371ARL2_9FIRM|nr:hypothetical protein DWV06_16855 [Anaerosacchariphilus polymeriproducens]